MDIDKKIEKLVFNILENKSIITNKDFEYYNDSYNEFLDKNIKLVEFKKGENLTTLGGKVDRILIHLSGEVSVYKFAFTGVSVRNGISKAPEIYGLYESLINIPEYAVTLEAKTKVIALELMPKDFIESINKNHNLSLYSLKFLANFTDKLLNRNNRLTLNTKEENLALYILEELKDSPLPYELKASKLELSENINISNRSLYRMLIKFEESNYLTREKGKIIISRDNKKELEKLIKSTY